MGLMMWASVPDGDKRIFVFSKTPKLVVEPTQPPVQWVAGILSLGVKHWAMMLAIHLPPSAKGENKWSLTSTPLVCCLRILISLSLFILIKHHFP